MRLMVDDRLAAIRVLQRAFGARVRLERKRAGLSQQQVAEQIGVTGPTISALENGHRGPSIEALCRLAAVLNVPPGVLLPPLEELNQLFSASDIVSKFIRELDEEATR
jgi:transcriptional regulator with XRE-family HTH domain